MSNLASDCSLLLVEMYASQIASHKRTLVTQLPVDKQQTFHRDEFYSNK